MPDEKTLEWLERREYRLEKTGYYMSPWDFTNKTLFCMTERPNWKDCAEFEARVAAKLAGTGPEPCEHGKVKHCPWPRSVIEGKRMCSFCRMKYARVEVEEEMDRP